ncbi:MAG: hypothetical protein O2887_09000 [Bacteroidetes bacterium]|nr:hypothetical protein [Bacteroidota bacterium]
MKKTVTLLLGILVSIAAINLSAQELPKTGAALTVSTKSIEMKTGQSAQVELVRLRSKSYQKAAFGVIRINSPEGIKVEFSQDAANVDLFLITVSTSETLAYGKYTITVQGEGKNASKVKATMFSVLVGDGENLAQVR